MQSLPRVVSCLLHSCKPVTVRHLTRRMHIVQFIQSGKQCIGLRVGGDKLLNLSEFAPTLPTDVCSALTQDQQLLLSEAKRCAQSTSVRQIPVEDVELLQPVTRPDKVVCIGLNYKDHCEELGIALPKEPVVFSKFSSCITRSGDVQIPSATKCLDWESELVVVIGKKARDVSEADAMDYVFGYTAANDVSARDLTSSTKNSGQFLLAKALDNFCPLASDIVTKDEIADVHDLKISTKVNGTLRQNSNTKQLIFRVPQIIAYLSGMFTLLPGDIILTGTPGGVGAGMKPPVFLKSGDTVKVEVENIGSVTNKFI